MSPRPGAPALTSIMLLLCLAPALTAQSGSTRWGIRLTAAEARFGGGADGGADGTLQPDRSTFVAVRLERSGAVNLGIEAATGRTYATLVSPEIVLADRTQPLRVYSLGLRGSRRVLGRTGAGELRVGLGANGEWWRWNPEPGRFRVGVRGAAEVRAPLTRAVALVAEAALTVSGSPFRAEELPDGYRRRGLRRREFGLALEYRW